MTSAVHLRSLAACGLAVTFTLFTVACGPGYLTPEEVRSHLEAPKGAVTSSSIGRATRDYVRAQKASGAERSAMFFKDSESDGGAAAWAAGVIEAGAMEKAVAMSAVSDIGDLFCAASLVASIATFDSCSENPEDCEAELVIDSCVLRIGEGGDALAKGRIRFRIKNQERPEFHRTELSIEFEDFESTVEEGEGITQYFGGLIAIETTATESAEGNAAEVIFSCDLDEQRRSQDRGLFDDGILERQRLTVAMRFTAAESTTEASGTLEILAFLDDSDDSRDESVVLSLAAESRRLDDESPIAGATLAVRGSNGAFSCTWSSASEAIEGETRSYSSQGICLDEETGEEFSWASTATYTDG